MCSRYEIDVEWEAIVEEFGLGGGPVDFTAGVIRPTDKAPVIFSDRAESLHWGLPAHWDGKPLINARSETLQQKQTFKPLLSNRCVVPARSYFEWRREGKARLKNRISLENEQTMGFAGLVSGDHFTIITCQPSPSIAHIHNRMPVILPKSAQAEWCNSGRSYEDVHHLLKPFTFKNLIAIEDTPPASPQADLFR